MRNLTGDQVEDVLGALAKARGIAEVVSSAITNQLGTDGGAPFADSLWAACDVLDHIKGILHSGAAA